MSNFSSTCIAAAIVLATPAQAGPAPVAGLGAPVAVARLDGARGGSAMNANAALTGTVSGNTASQVVTGANAIQASSFAGATGIPIVIQNTGANVLIQNATVINLQFSQ